VGKQNKTMACFSDTSYANWSYQILVTLNNASGSTPVSLGCYSAMNLSEQLYQFYKAFQSIGEPRETLEQNCFVQLTDSQQWKTLNSAIELALTPAPEPEPEPEPEV
jgi:hypothetical protein